MRISRIDLSGFKSFCEKTTLDMSQPVTGIVGPNGCGKSNVVDALRWAMGEQSARHLRGQTMDDVIFNGSDTRGPSGMAEVSITFDVAGRAPVGYLDYSEITVTRRLHRDGTSEYLINKVPVRLRDITGLFLGTGIGRKAYSIIEQGRVGLIVSSKPEERRYFIEEAAGITKYRRLRQTAERRMEATKQNLLRVGDVVSEMSRRIGTLRRQAQKAERYRKYRTEVQDIDLWAASHRLLEIVARQKAGTAQLLAISAQQEDAQHTLAAREATLESARLAASEDERTVSEAQEALYTLENKIKLNESRIEFHSQESDSLIQRADQAGRELEEINRHRAHDRERLDEIETRVSRLGEDRKACRDKLDLQTKVVRQAEEALQEVERATHSERDRIGRAEQRCAGLDAELQSIEIREREERQRSVADSEEQNEVRARISELEGEVARREAELASLRAARNDIVSAQNTAAAQIGEMRSAAGRGEAELEVLRTELYRRRSRLTSLEEIQSRYEGYGHGTRAVMQRQIAAKSETDRKAKGRVDERVLGVVADVIDVPELYETALESALGHRLGAVIVADQQTGMESVHYLKEGDLGRSSFVTKMAVKSPRIDDAPIGFVWHPQGATEQRPVVSAAGSGSVADQPAQVSRVVGGLRDGSVGAAGKGVHGPMLSLISCDKDYTRVAETLLGDIVVTDTLDDAISAWRSFEGCSFVTIGGEIVADDGTITGGSRSGEVNGVLRHKREVNELAEIVRSLEVQYDEAMERQVNTKSKLSATEATLDRVRGELHSSEKEVIRCEKDLEQMRATLKTLNVRSERLEERLEAANGRLEAAQRRKEEARSETASLRERLEAGREALAVHEQDRVRLIEALRAESEILTEAKVAAAEVDSSYSAAGAQRIELSKANDERQARIKRLEDDSSTGGERATQLRAEIEELKRDVAAKVGEHSDLKGCFEQSKERYDQTIAQIREVELGVKEARQEVESLGVQFSDYRVQARELEMQRDHLRQSIDERYDLELTAIAGDYHLRARVSDAQLDRAEEVRRLIQRMGEINLTAIDEYTELEERLTFLSGQQKDLEAALGQLQRAIQTINRTCRERFIETFDRVNTHFQEIFPRLFRGGKAKLILSESEDILRGGVEIVAQPPGKKLLSLDMMSGGEKALTATSLIFAMFLVRPTPFCLLDEVDAPLDEANIVRFRGLVRELSSGSQFIVITHSHVTMEVVDRLYGVTMEEPGISKIVSVNLTGGKRVAA